MLHIAKSNLYYCDDIDRSIWSILRLIEVYDRNVVLLTPPYYLANNSIYKTSASHVSILNYENYEDFVDKISDKSNLFRADLIIIDLIGKSLFDLYRYNNYLKSNSKLDYIIFFKTPMKDVNLNVDLSCTIKHKFEDKKTIHYIEYNDSQFTIDSCIKSYIRGVKIDSIFGSDDK